MQEGEKSIYCTFVWSGRVFLGHWWRLGLPSSSWSSAGWSPGKQSWHWQHALPCLWINTNTACLKQFKQTTPYNLTDKITSILKHMAFYFGLLFNCLAGKEVPQFTNYCLHSFKASVLSPTRITAYAIRWDIAANLNGSLISCNCNAWGK